MYRIVLLQEAPSCYPAEVYEAYFAPQTRQFAWLDVAYRGEAGQFLCRTKSWYSRSNSTKCAASGAYNVRLG
jgi:hypothetical protein